MNALNQTSHLYLSLGSLFNAEDFPERWQCGVWSSTHGWVHISSDIVIWLSYMAIPILMLWYLRGKKLGVDHRLVFWLFMAFIFFCGSTHLMEALIFYWPAYRLLGLLKLLTAVISFVTVICLIPVVPKLINAPTRKELENEIESRSSTEQRLRASEQLFRTAMTSAPIGMALVATDGKWMRMNRQLCDLFGYSEEELSKMNFQEITHPEDLDSDLDYLRKTLAGEIESYSMEKRYLHKDGHVIYAKLHVALIRNESGEAPFFVSQIEDISKEKKLLQRQSGFIHELKQKTQDLQQIVYVTSHDLRSPLVNIIGFSSELELTCEDLKRELESIDRKTDRLGVIIETELPEILSFISGSARRMDRLLRGLLQYSRLGRYVVSIQLINMDRMVDDLLQDLTFQIKEVDAIIERQPLLDCYGDLTLISQLFRNVIDNAIKYRSPNRKLRLAISAKELDNHIRYTLTDNGMGIAPEHQSKIFEVFHRLKPGESEGDGLGLSICNLVAHRMEGRIWLESVPDEGSSFHVELPNSEIALSEHIEAMSDAGLNSPQTNED